MDFLQKKNIPNSLTILRLALIPVLVIAFLFDGKLSRIIALFIFVGASLTDFFDGYFARLYNVSSEFGRVFDPISDKLLVTTAIIMLIYINPGDIVILFCALIITLRELLVSGLKEFMGTSGRKLYVMQIARYKTFIQMLALSFLILGGNLPIGGLFGSDFSLNIDVLGKVLLVVASIMTIITGWMYLQTVQQFLNRDRGK